MKILVTGASGHLGAAVVEALLGSVATDQLAVSVRNVEKADHLRARGVEVRRGDLDDEDSLARTFRGVQRLLLISTNGDNATRLRQHRAAVAEAARAGVEFIAYTSLTRADASPMALGQVHRETEAAIRATQIPYCFLRNNWYLENEAGTIQGAAAGAPVVTAAADGGSAGSCVTTSPWRLQRSWLGRGTNTPSTSSPVRPEPTRTWRPRLATCLAGKYRSSTLTWRATSTCSPGTAFPVFWWSCWWTHSARCGRERSTWRAGTWSGSSAARPPL